MFRYSEAEHSKPWIQGRGISVERNRIKDLTLYPSKPFLRGVYRSILLCSLSRKDSITQDSFLHPYWPHFFTQGKLEASQMKVLMRCGNEILIHLNLITSPSFLCSIFLLSLVTWIVFVTFLYWNFYPFYLYGFVCDYYDFCIYIIFVYNLNIHIFSLLPIIYKVQKSFVNISLKVLIST